MGCKQAPGSIDCYAKAEPDEPMFILLARDASAPQLIEMWADLRERHDEEAAVVAEAREIAEQMRAWRDHNREPIGWKSPDSDPMGDMRRAVEAAKQPKPEARTIFEHRVDHEHTESDVISGPRMPTDRVIADRIRHAKIDEPADPSPYACIDGGTRHHTCTDEECYRALNCAPLSGTMLNDQWPSDARPVWRQA